MPTRNKPSFTGKIFSLVSIVIIAGLTVTIILLLRKPSQLPGAFSQDDCSAPSIEWMTVSSEIDHKVLAGLASQLAAAATTDAEGIKKLAGTKMSGDFKTALKDVSADNTHSERTVNVTQDFFQKATAYRMAVCNLERQISKHVITSPQVLEMAQTQLFQLSADFSKIGQEETNKMQTLNTQQHLGIDGQFQAKTGRLSPSSPGIYTLSDDLFAGDCVMRKGSSLVFGTNGVAHFTLYVRTKHTTNRDIWHQSWDLEDGQHFGPFDSPDLHQDEAETTWEGTFNFKGPQPIGSVIWDCGC